MGLSPSIAWLHGAMNHQPLPVSLGGFPPLLCRPWLGGQSRGPILAPTQPLAVEMKGGGGAFAAQWSLKAYTSTPQLLALVHADICLPRLTDE